MVSPSVDLDHVDSKQELVVRAGNVRPDNPKTDVAQILMDNYEAVDEFYPGIYGLSVLFQIGANIESLAEHNPVPHGKLSYGTIEILRTTLNNTGYGVVYHTESGFAGSPFVGSDGQGCKYLSPSPASRDRRSPNPGPHSRSESASEAEQIGGVPWYK